MKLISKICLLIGAALLLASLFQPIWRIELDAPQYPEGLALQIHVNDIKGDVDIINGLNHYIGMKTLHKEDFIEFTVLPYIIGFFAAMFVLVVLINKRFWLHALLIAFIAFGVIALADFWRWEYNYGHDLDPNAAIKVPGMAYQPPLIGFKQLLNFGAYSIPDIGGWMFIAAGLLLLFAVWWEWRQSKKMQPHRTLSKMVIPVLVCFQLSSCSTDPRPLRMGVDACHACKMTLTDARFGVELVSSKGKVYIFDDTGCAIRAMQQEPALQKNSALYIAAFDVPGKLVAVDHANLLKSVNIHGPMNGQIAAFTTAEARKQAQQTLSGDMLAWKDLLP
jgi:copper chaperone NosL